jgi:D-xylose transport system permease protein
MSTDQQDMSTTPSAVATAPEVESTAAVEPSLVDANLVGSLSEYVRAWLKRVRGGEAGNIPVIAGLILIIAVFESQNGNFITARNFAALLTQMSYFVLFGMAEVFVLLLGEIDLSTGYVAASSASITLILAGQQHNLPWYVGALAGLAFAALAGFVQGLVITRLRVPSFVVTLGGLLLFEGVLLFILNRFAGNQSGGTVAIINSILIDIDNGNLTPVVGWVIMIALVVAYAAFTVFQNQRRRAHGLVAPPMSISAIKIAMVAIAGVAVVVVCNLDRGRTVAIRGIPICVFLIIGIVILATFLLNRTRFGRYVYAVGGNAEAARRAGINVSRIRLVCFTLCAFTAGVAGLFYSSYIQSISTSVDGGNLVLFAVAAAVIGGTSLFGGRGKMVHALLGGLVIAVIYNGMGLLALGADAQDAVTALVLVAAATVDAVTRRGRTA